MYYLHIVLQGILLDSYFDINKIQLDIGYKDLSYSLNLQIFSFLCDKKYKNHFTAIIANIDLALVEDVNKIVYIACSTLCCENPRTLSTIFIAGIADIKKYSTS
jgi:hypothetical protein